LEKRQNDSLVLDRRILVAGARFSINRRREKSMRNKDGTMKIQAFHKPNSKSGISDTIFPTAPQLLVIPFYASGIKLYPKPTFGFAEKL
jgi:hypothetical protein